MIEKRDEYRHSIGKGQWNESYWFNVFDPVKKIGIMCRIGTLPNQNKSNFWFFLTKGDKILHENIDFNLPFLDQDIEELCVGELKFYLIEPLKRFRVIGLAKEKIIDFLWNGFTPIFDFGELKALPENIGSNHYQQIGHVSGLIQLKDELIDFIGYGVRDHSWGEREWGPVESWKMAEGNFNRDFAFSTLTMKLKNGQTMQGGFLFDGKRISVLQDFQITENIKDRDSNKEPIKIVLRDKDNEVFTISGTTVSCCPLDMGNLLDLELFTYLTMGSFEGSGMLSVGFPKLLSCIK